MQVVKLAVALTLAAALGGCGTVARTEAAWDAWRANANEKNGNHGTAADYRRKERLNRAEAARHRF